MVNTSETPSVFLCDWIDNKIKFVGHLFCWVNALLIIAILLQVFLRYGLSSGFVGIEELQWHLYAVGVMFGVSYAQTCQTHVRVDIFYSRYSERSKHIVEIVTVVIFTLPFAIIIFLHSIDFFYESWRVNEGSDASYGLPARWIIKAVIPISFGMLILSSISRLIRECIFLYDINKGKP